MMKLEFNTKNLKVLWLQWNGTICHLKKIKACSSDGKIIKIILCDLSVIITSAVNFYLFAPG